MAIPKNAFSKEYLRILVVACVLTIAATSGHAQRKANRSNPSTSSQPFASANSITADQLRDYLFFVAADEMEGRDTPSRGLDTVAKFIALNLSRWGLKPAGDEGTYFQHIALRRDGIDPAKTYAEIDGTKFQFGDDFLALRAPGSVSGPLIYVGHGWIFNAKKINPYEGINIKDKIVVIHGRGLPQGIVPADRQGKRGEDWQDPYSYAQDHGAKAVIMLPNFWELNEWEAKGQSMLEGASRFEAFMQPNGPVSSSLPLEWGGGRGGYMLGIPGGVRIPAIIPSVRMAQALFSGEKRTALEALNLGVANQPAEPFEFRPDRKVNFTVAIRSQKSSTQNVVTVVEGSDPILKNEYVVVGAHYDHLGGTSDGNDKTDRIRNGADDNGSGTVALLALAEAFAKGPRPKRSIMLAWYCAEEKGLLGSRYLTQFSPISLNQIVSQINMDMIGRSKQEGDTSQLNKDLSGPNEIYIMGSRTFSTELGDLVDAVNKSYLNLSFNYRFDDGKFGFPFFASDHAEYAKKGIPFVFFFSGFHADYHSVLDSADKVDYKKLEKIARTVYATALTLANAPKRPTVDKQLPPGVVIR